MLRYGWRPASHASNVLADVLSVIKKHVHAYGRIIAGRLIVARVSSELVNLLTK